MKNAISYYYNLNPSVIHQNGKIFRFSVDNTNYILTICQRVEEIEEIYDLSISLLQQGLPVHQIILNNSNQKITLINDLSYVLMKITVDINIKIKLDDIIYFNNMGIIRKDYISLKRNNWFDLWSTKIDYFEYQVNQLGKKYPLIRDSFSYYVGLAENGILLFKTVNANHNLAVTHRRLLITDTLYELYDPFNLVIDFRIRDICEYFKSCFFAEIETIDSIKQYIYSFNFSYDERILFFTRMLFPSYYFDFYEAILSNTLEEEKVQKIINKVDDYELLLVELYLFFKNFSFPEIEWLKTS